MLASSIGGIDLDCCVYNASGPRTGALAALEKIHKSRAGAVLSKSATLVEQNGNPLPRYKEIDVGGCPTSINSEGLPNRGIDFYISEEVVSALKGKPYIVSLSGLSLKDNLEMFTRVMAVADGISAIELNLACPNIPGKPIIGYDFDQMNECVKAFCNHPDFGKMPLGVKLPPYFDMPHFQRAAEVLNQYPIKFVTCINTIGNALFVDGENECASIAPKVTITVHTPPRII
jgi:dihydroorotate dehydrogenase (fumarate)